MTKTAVIYTRVSSEPQGRGFSLQTQLEACRKFCAENGYTVTAEFEDMHSGTDLSRPGLDKLFEFVDERKTDAMIVYDVDRLSREVGHQAIIEVEMDRRAVKILFVLGGNSETPEGELLQMMKRSIAQFENRQRTERSRRGKMGAAKAGRVICPAGRAPFGYSYIKLERGGKLVINEDQAVIVQQMYAWLVNDGLSSYAISKRLWEGGILSKGDYSAIVYKKSGKAQWSPCTVRRIISNTTYKGDWHFNKTRSCKINGKRTKTSNPKSEWIKVDVPAIVDDDTWERAQVQLAKNRQNSKRNTRREYLLRGMVFCGCGRRWTGIYKNHLKRAYYRCPSNEAEHWRARCPNNYSIRTEPFEEAIWNTVVTILLDPDNLRVEIERRRQEFDKTLAQNKLLRARIDREIANIAKKEAILLDELLQGDFSRDVIEDRRRGLVARRQELEIEASRIEKIMNLPTVSLEQEAHLTQMAAQVGNNLASASFAKKRRVLELLELKVEVLSRTQVKISGVVSDGLVVDITSA